MGRFILLLGIITISFACKNTQEDTSAAQDKNNEGVHAKNNEWPGIYTKLGLPEYNAGKIVSSELRRGDLKSEEIIIIDTNEGPPEVKAFYEETLITDGWKKLEGVRSFSGLSELDVYVARFTKGRNQLYINAKRTPSVTSRVNISVSEYFDNK